MFAAIAAMLAFFAAIVTALIAQGSKISEFRQAWINNLRSDIAIYLSKVHQASNLQEQRQNENDQKKEIIRLGIHALLYEAIVFRMRIEMMFKPGDHEDFLGNLRDLPMQHTGKWYKGGSSDRLKSMEDCLEQARQILKSEWEITKEPLYIGASISSAESARIATSVKTMVDFIF